MGRSGQAGLSRGNIEAKDALAESGQRASEKGEDFENLFGEIRGLRSVEIIHKGAECKGGFPDW